MVKALHVTGFWSGNFYYRGYLPAIANGYQVSNDFIDGQKQNDGQALVRKMDTVDVVMFQRPNYDDIVTLMKLAKQKNKIVVFDDDDTFKLGEGVVPQNETEQAFGEKVNATRIEALRVAHGAICTTEFLAQELREVNNNTVIIPNCIDPDDEGEVEENKSGRLRVLILGSVVSNDDWKIAKKAIEKISDRVTFVLMGVPEEDKYTSYKDDMKFWRSLPHIEEIGNVVFGDYYNTIQNTACDVVIAPRADNYFNRCKSNLKFLESSLFGIPFIGQSFNDGLSPYEVNPQDINFLTLAKTAEDWENVLEDFIANPLTYKEKAIKAKEYVLEEYSIYKHAHKYEDFYKSLLK